MAYDASQFQPAMGANIMQAAQRRLGTALNATPMQTNPTDPMAPAATVAAPGTTPAPTATAGGLQTGLGLQGAAPGSAPTLPHSGQSVALAPPNPLAGGTGDAGLDKYLGTDSTYQSQLSALMKQLDDYNAQRNLQASQTQADYDAKIKAMNTQTSQDQLNMRNAAAARGILYSGIYANQLGQYNDANQQQMTNLLGGLQNTKDTAGLAYTQELDSLEAAKQNAIQQAAARKAASLGTF